MDRIAKLVVAASEARRQIWASMPILARLDDFFVRLATPTSDAFGRTVYEEFLKRGVQSMPEFTGARPPTHYGKDFGSKCFKILMTKLHNPDTVEDVMSEWLVRFLDRGSKLLKPDSDLRSAEQYVLRALQNDSINWLKKKREILDKQNQDEDPTHSGDEGTSLYDRTPSFSGAVDNSLVEEMLSKPAAKSALKRVHPDAELYVRLSVLDGYTDREIIGDESHPTMLTHPIGSAGKPITERNWNSFFKPKIYAALKETFKDLHP
jgi:DNA-directed RNA polymerase specialized sigma24 family protein